MNKYQDTNRFLKDVSASSHVALLFGLYSLLLLLVSSPSAANWIHADPVMKIFPRTVTLWGTPILSLLLFLIWRAIKPLSPQELAVSLKAAIGGCVTVIAALLVLRLAVGPQLPAFIPPEESVKPGYLLGMATGLTEEMVMRLILTPILFVGLRRWFGFHKAVLTSIAIASLGFALWHELGSIQDPFILQHFATRFMVPGVVMGLAVFYISPVFLVTLHCAAHIVIPLLFI